jgi:hypothetical protein
MTILLPENQITVWVLTLIIVFQITKLEKFKTSMTNFKVIMSLSNVKLKFKVSLNMTERRIELNTNSRI